MANPWRPLNDGVMGGLSEGDVVMHDTAMSWKGQTRLENNGGFASRSCALEPHRFAGDGKGGDPMSRQRGAVQMTLETSERWWMPYAYASFNPSKEWQDVTLTAKDFSVSQAQMGDLKAVKPNRELGDVLRMGLMKYDGTAQSFDTEVASIPIPSLRAVTGLETASRRGQRDFLEIGDCPLAVVIHVCSAVHHAAKLGQGSQNV